VLLPVLAPHVQFGGRGRRHRRGAWFPARSCPLCSPGALSAARPANHAGGDIYNSYRRIRSDSYKDMILSNMGKAGMGRGAR
jgi:hypothetical protein